MKSRLAQVVVTVFALFALGAGVSADPINDRIFIAAISGGSLGAGLVNPQSVCFDHQSHEAIVADPGGHSIVIFDERLNVKFSFRWFVTDQNGHHVAGEPRAVAVNSFGELIVADNLSSLVHVLDFRGRELETIDPARLLGDTTLSLRPQALAVDETGNLYVLLAGDRRETLVVDPDFNYVREIGSAAADSTGLQTPLALHVADGRVYITDLYGEPAVKVFDTSGTYLFGFAEHDIKRPDLSFPAGITTIKPDGGPPQIWISDGLRQTIKVYDHNGEFLAMVGGFGILPGEFQYPSALTSANDTTVLALERVGKRLQCIELR